MAGTCFWTASVTEATTARCSKSACTSSTARASPTQRCERGGVGQVWMVTTEMPRVPKADALDKQRVIT
eukprot:328918-Chlamydomonas_euryale.AAC.1